MKTLKNVLASFLLLLITGFTTLNANNARVQVIHNSADAAASVVDVWLDNTLLLDNFAFRTASPFVDAPAGVEFTVAIKDQNSTSPENPIWSQNYTLADGETYILVAEGIVSPNGYTPATPFDIAVYPMGREMANMNDKTDVLVHHGSTDAPTVDVYETGVGAGMIVDDLAYADFAGYLELAVDDYSLQIRDESGQIAVATFSAPLEQLGLGGAAITVLASGFLNPANNSNGPAFGLYVALASGGELVPLTNSSNIEDIILTESLVVYPNPSTDFINLEFKVAEDKQIQVEIVNLLGKTMVKEVLESTEAERFEKSFDVSGLPSGLYFFTLKTGDSTLSRKFHVVR